MENKEQDIVFYADFENLPDVPLLKVFSYLTTDQLYDAARVCYRWFVLSRDPSLWKSVDLHHIQLSSERIEKLFRILPNYTKYLRIHGFSNDDELDSHCMESEWGPETRNEAFFNCGHRLFSNEKVPQFSLLQNRCKDLQTIIMDSIVLTHSSTFRRFTLSKARTEVWNLPLNVRVLSVRRCQIVHLFFFHGVSWLEEIVFNIKVMDCTKCIYFGDGSLRFLKPNRLPCLQELYLAGCPISDNGIRKITDGVPGLKVLDIEMTKVSCYSFRTLNESCKFLEQLFIGGSVIEDEELRRVQLGSLRNLKVICLKGTRTSWESRRILLSSLPTLQSMNGLQCSRVLSEELPDDYCKMCDHFLLRERDFEV